MGTGEANLKHVRKPGREDHKQAGAHRHGPKLFGQGSQGRMIRSGWNSAGRRCVLRESLRKSQARSNLSNLSELIKYLCRQKPFTAVPSWCLTRDLGEHRFMLQSG